MKVCLSVWVGGWVGEGVCTVSVLMMSGGMRVTETAIICMGLLTRTCVRARAAAGAPVLIDHVTDEDVAWVRVRVWVRVRATPPMRTLPLG